MKKKNLVKLQENQSVPGVGVAGQVMCPFSFMAPKLCIKQGCEFWVELNYGKQKVGRCAIAWLPILFTEVRQAIDRLNEKIKK